MVRCYNFFLKMGHFDPKLTFDSIHATVLEESWFIQPIRSWLGELIKENGEQGKWESWFGVAKARINRGSDT